MTFEEILDQAIALLQRRGRVTYRTLKRQFSLDEDALEDLKAGIIKGQRLAADEDGEVLVWIGGTTNSLTYTAEPTRASAGLYPIASGRENSHLARALEGERKQVTVLFADLKGSMELLADRDPEEARQLLDPVLERMMAAVHRYEGTVNQVYGRWHHGALWRPHCPRGPCGAGLLCRAGHAGGHPALQRRGAAHAWA